MSALQQSMELVDLEQYESLPDERRAEVYDGFLYDRTSPSQVHQTISVELLTRISVYIREKKGKCRVLHAPFDVKLSDQPLTIVQPDILVICDEEKLDGKRCNGSPDFIIEIVSPGNPENDYIRKLYYYKNSGVREYWIVDPQRRIVTVYDFEGNRLSVQYSFDSVVKVNIYEDLFINFSEIAELL